MFSATLRAVEQHGVDAALALDHVVVVAGVPHEQVVAGAEEGDVVAVAAEDGVVAGAADDGIGAEAAEGLQGDLVGGQAAGVDEVVAAEAVDGQDVRGVGVIDGHLGRSAIDDDAAADRGDRDGVVGIGGVYDDGVEVAIGGRAA